MHNGRSLGALAAELDRQKASRKDYIAPAGALSARAATANAEGGKGEILLAGLNGGDYALTDVAHNQMSEYLGIPRGYYDRMGAEAPDLLARSINTWLGKAGAERRMVRTLDGRIRAILSDRYRPLDNLDLLGAAMPAIAGAGAEVVSAELTERRLYVKAILPSLRREIKSSAQKGDIVEGGLVLSNSEIGSGAVRVEPFIRRIVCANGMIADDAAIRKHHIGRGDKEDGIREFLRDETREAEDRAFWLKVRDVVAGAFDPTVMDRYAARAEAAARAPLATGDLGKVIELAAEATGLQDKTRDAIVRALIEGRDLTRWGVANAITAQGNEEPDYEAATAFERAGGAILALPERAWAAIAAGDPRLN